MLCVSQYGRHPMAGIGFKALFLKETETFAAHIRLFGHPLTVKLMPLGFSASLRLPLVSVNLTGYTNVKGCSKLGK